MPHNSAQNAAGAGTLAVSAPPMLRSACIYLLAFVALYEPMCCGLTAELASLVVFMLLVLVCLFLWVCEGALRGELRWRGGPLVALGIAFLAWMGLTCFRAHNGFAAAQVWLLFAGYGLTGFMFLQYADTAPVRRFMLSCVLATAATLAAYGLLHFLFYMPALSHWLERDPYYFKSLFDVQDGMFRDLEVRVRGNRAVGSFITSNQLSSFLLPGIFLLAGAAVALWPLRKSSAPGRTRALSALAWAGLAVLVLVTFYLSGSKGGMVGFACGIVVFVLGSASAWARRHWWKLLAACAVVGVLFLAGQRAGVVPQWRFFRASLGVRVDYWTVSMEMIRMRPVMGIGPGGWQEYYTMLKSPRFEETRLAHSAYIQIWSETGTVGLALFLLLWGGVAAGVVRGLLRAGGGETAGEESNALAPRWGLALGAAALAVDYFFVGTFKPPQVGSPGLLEAVPWAVYVVLYLVWAVAFHTSHSGMALLAASGDGRRERFLLWGIAAGLAAFLVHSAAEFTFRVPALGVSAVVLAVALLLGAAPPKLHRTRLSSAAAAVAVVVAFGIAMCWVMVVTPRALDYSLADHEVFVLKGELGGRSPEGGPTAPLSPEQTAEKRLEIIKAYHKAIDAVPWDDNVWHDLAVHDFTLALELSSAPGRQAWAGKFPSPTELVGESEAALRRAIELNPLKAKHHAALGRLLAQTGRAEQAVGRFQRSAQLHPSLPASWLEFARGAEQADGLNKRACEAYAEAYRLNDRKVQYHERNLLREEESRLLEQKVRECGKARDNRAGNP